MNYKNYFLLVFVCLAFCACDTLNLPSTDVFKSEDSFNLPDDQKSEHPDLVTEVRTGKMADNLKITAIDGSFVLTGGQTFSPSNYTNGWQKPGKGLAKKFNMSTGTKVKIDFDYDVDDPENVGKKIKKKGEIYGILEFNKVYKACTDLPVTRTYFIDIPYANVASAMGARISVAYELYGCDVELPDGTKKNNNYTSWVIWLSDVPF